MPFAPRTVVARVLRPVLLLVLVVSVACTGGEPEPGVRGSPRLAGSPERSSGYVVIGDFGVGGADETALSSAIRRWVAGRPFDALVTAGDNVYGEGSPDRFGEAWKRPFGWVRTAGVPVIASLGNHDIETDGGAPEMRLFRMPGPWYRERIGPVEFFVLDGNDLSDADQLDWLTAALSSSTAPWKVLVFHQPVYSCGKHGSTPAATRYLLPAIAGRGVDLVVNGHDHDYQRFAPIDGTTYVVTGAGAASLYQVGDCPEGTPRPVAWNDLVHSFLYVSATAGRLIGTAVSVQGQVLDTFELTNAARPTGSATSS